MLTLPIKKKWFDMIASGEKKEEYRSLSPYYKKRFENLFKEGFDVQKQILLRNGYSKSSPSIVVNCTLNIGKGNANWGAEEGQNYYVLSIIN